MFFNCRNGQKHFVRYLGHGFFVDAAEEENPAALAGKRIDDPLQLPQGVAGNQLGFGIAVGLQQVKVGNALKADDLVAAGIVDDQVAGDGEEKGAAGQDIFPAIGRIGAGQNLRHHIIQFVMGREYPSHARAERSLMRQYNSLEPFQLGANPMHVGPLLS
jgi:hypothetical protein